MNKLTWDRALLGIAALFFIIAGVQYAVGIILPLLLALFLSVILMIPVASLVNRGLNKALAVTLVLGVSVLVIAGTGVVIGESAQQFVELVPHYEERFRSLMHQALDTLAGFGIPVSKDVIMGAADPGAGVRVLGGAVQAFGGVMSNMFLILFTLMFVLMEGNIAEAKLRAIVSNFDEDVGPSLNRFKTSLMGYLGVQSSDAAMLGVLVAVWLTILDVNFALLWGLIAFLMNFVPAVGPAIAIVPPVLLALVDHGWTTFALAAGGLASFTVIIGNVIEPRRMGKNLGLSPLVVFLSLGFWGFVLGPVGLFLSVPLTMTLKIGFENHEGTHWIALLFASADELEEVIAQHEQTRTAET